MLSPVPARWFEVLCSRGEAVHTSAVLAATGAVEIEVRPNLVTDVLLRELATGLADFEQRQTRYGRYWARGNLRPAPMTGAPEVVLARALDRLSAWQRDADRLIDALQACEEESTRLKWLGEVVARLIGGSLDFDLVARSGPVLGTFCVLLPSDAEPRFPDWVIARGVSWEGHQCFLIVGPAERLEDVKVPLRARKGRIIERPAWLCGRADEAHAAILARRRQLSTRIVHLYAELDSLYEDHRLGDVLAQLVWLAWFARQVGGLERASDHLVWITGWSNDLTGRSLAAALEGTESRALLRFRPPPPGIEPPQILDNPRWMRPFELFARAFGVPGADEADPTPVLAFVVPLIFGYMFGDLGQGLVLAAAGWWLRDRFEPARLLMYCGLSAMAFGLVFGSLFGREDLIPALWLHPLDAPLVVILVPLIFAVGLLVVGQMLAAVGARQRGDLASWWRVDAGFLLFYLGLLGWLADPAAAWLAALGLAWYLIGAIVTSDRWLGVLAAVGRLLENGLQILVNTLSFARVGAFALAHAALSLAVVTMADAAPLLWSMLILILGNLVIIALEGLVVSIQTTRLMLFEFFNRFLRGTGRVFRPLPPPLAGVVRAGPGASPTPTG